MQDKLQYTSKTDNFEGLVKLNHSGRAVTSEN